MTDIQAWLDQGRTLADQAADHVGRLSSGDDRWTMTVPPKDTDSDMALMSILDGRLPAALDALQAVLDMHAPIDALDYGARTGPRKTHVCTGCGQDDGNWNYWPCPTVRAIQAAIGDTE